MSTWLERILEAKRERLKRAKQEMPLSALKERLPDFPKSTFESSLRKKGGLPVVAEIKRASPSKGILRKDLDPVQLARAYENGGAKAISVLTEEAYFLGSLDDLRRVRENTGLPILCKDFILDPYQVYEARYYGADALLLILSILEDSQYLDLHTLALELGLTPVAEVHDQQDFQRALRAEVRAIGVNRRNLKTFEVERVRSEDLLGDLPEGVLKIAESGVRSREEIQELQAKGYDACLVGEALVRAEDPEALLRSWMSLSK